jgi:hypothetical protein
MDEIVEKQTIQNIDVQAFPLLLWQRWIFGVSVIMTPIINFTLVGALRPEWQSGETSAYIALFLLPEAAFVFFPLLAYSVISYVLFLIDTDRFSRYFIVRSGIYTGVFLALQYSILTIVVLNLSPILLIYLLPIIITKVCFWLMPRWNTMLAKNIFLGAGIVILFALIFTFDSIDFYVLVFFVGFFSPFWVFLIFTQSMLWLFKNHENKFTIMRGMGLFAWFSSYVYALRFNILKMHELYATLPVFPPSDCYIATAASKGHPRVVGSKIIKMKNGECFTVNKQLQRLKCFELAMIVFSPGLHGLARRIYDVVGKKLAVRIKNPYLADIAFLILIPVEWISFLSLKFFIPEIESFSKKIYHS